MDDDNLDDKLRTALRSGSKIEIDPKEIDSVHSLLSEMFGARRRVIMMGSLLKIVAFWVLAVIAGIYTYTSDDGSARFLWAVTFIVATTSVAFMFTFHWMLLNRNAITRELKQLEVQIAGLADRVGDREA